MLKKISGALFLFVFAACGHLENYSTTKLSPEDQVLLLHKNIGPFVMKIKSAMQKFELPMKKYKSDLNKRLELGDNVSCSYQIYRELRWKTSFTDDVAGAEELIGHLRDSLKVKDQSFAERQSADGSWGLCYHEAFMKLFASKEALLEKTRTTKIIYPKFLDAFNDPDRLHNYLSSIVQDDVAASHEINRIRIDDSIAALGRFILDDMPSNYSFHPKLKEAYLSFLDDFWQNPETGTWGTWYVTQNGILKSDDLALTFHIINQRHGKVKHLDKIAARALQIQSLDFPVGNRLRGQYENHLNWDFVIIMRDAWDQMNENLREKAKKTLHELLNWCLKDSLQPDGTFRLSALDDTLGDAMENGVLFLTDIGYFNPKKRFWTQESFQGSALVRTKILAKLKLLGTQNHGFRDAYDSLLND